ncbi:hypothetical protein CDD80_5566 [Ophiocordyceps camponoti-rufipedis]|uniref:Eukaryotic translation initiation factor 5B n=1 Tax=Ophiocordyceps camponoti-rufipedis TaxID=2004952 RepID=A0A2C5YND4_9HYPO|nr:hypothetical protein CDD80_5566 [Ophiocordyceps camponoti-rufipedis]
MPPKKKGNDKKGFDDWENELGESIAPSQDTATNDSSLEPAVDNVDASAGGVGFMAMLRKNKEKRKKKGFEDENPPRDEDPQPLPAASALDGSAADSPSSKAKGKGLQGVASMKNDEPGDSAGNDGRILTNDFNPETTGKKKKVPAHLALIQKQQDELRRKREESDRREAEAKALADEEERLATEELKRKEEQKALKKQKEKERVEQLKKEGKFLTKAQREEKARNERKLQQMLAAGVKVGPQESTDIESKKKVTYESKKRRGKNEQKIDEDVALAEAAERSRIQAEKALKEAEERAAQEKTEAESRAAAEKHAAASDIEDDWELAAEAESVKDSWDAETDASDEQVEAAESNGSASTKRASKRNTKASADHKDKQPMDDDSLSSDDASEDERISAARQAEAQRKKEAAERRERAHREALAARSADNLRSPICCILGHVDTGKTKLLDKVRQTHVQEGEAGGITQQIGATYFPVDAIKQKTAVVNKDNKFEFKVPGLLVIDTPGHESFSNLRSRGSSLCNIAILVVDIMHGLEPQTLESMRLLRERKTPFIVALNKIDRLYGWKKVENNGFQESLALQNKSVHNEFKKRLDDTKLAFAEQGFNSELFYENKSMAKFVSLVPTSAHTGEGVPDMLKLIVQLTQERMVGSLMYLSEVQATVLEVKAIEGFGMTIDVILSNGVLREGDRIVLCGTEGAIKTNIRALLTPAPLRELRLKSAYVHNKEVKAALGVKISAPGLEGAIAGSRLMVVGPDDDEEDIEDEVESDLTNLLSRVEKSGRGVSVQASTLGSLEALLDFLKDCKIPVANVGIGPVYKRDIMQCGIMLEKAPDYAVMLCFDVKVDKEAQAYADDQGIKIFTADIIYHLFDAFTKHMDEMVEKKKEESKMLAVFPCVLKPIAIFNKTSPIVVGVDVIEGQLKINTPIAVVHAPQGTNPKDIVSLGRVTSIEREHKQIQVCKKGQPSVAVKIEMGGHQPMYGRQLEEEDLLYSLISRASIDCLKEYYRKDVSNDEWQLIVKLKPLFDVN